MQDVTPTGGSNEPDKRRDGEEEIDQSRMPLLEHLNELRQRLIYSLPELQPALRDEYNSLVTGVAEAMGRRLERGAHEVEIRAFAGAVIGAVMALGNRGPFSLDNVDQAMDVLESGLTLD